MQAVLNWDPVGGANSTGQRVEYRLKGATQWVVWSAVGKDVNTETITGLENNLIYEFQVVNLCSFGGPTDSLDIERIKITCPTPVTVTRTYDTVSFSFTALGGDITDYVITLKNQGGSIVGTTTKSVASGTVSGQFTGLQPSTQYNITIAPQTAGGTYQKTDCASTSVMTDALPVCNAPTNLTATLS